MNEPTPLSRLFDDHGLVVYRYVARRIGPQAAEDVTADVFCSAFASEHTFDPDRGAPIAWLMGIATNALAKHWRTEQRNLDTLAELGVDPLRSEVAASAEQHAAASVETRAVARVLGTLPDADREALMLYAWADLSYAQVAEALDVPIGTVRSRISRARDRLRDELEGNELEGGHHG